MDNLCTDAMILILSYCDRTTRNSMSLTCSDNHRTFHEYIRNYEKTSLIIATKKNCIKSVKSLLMIGIDPTYQENAAIYIACKNGYWLIFNILFKNKRVIESKPDYDRLLILAAGYGRETIVKTLMTNPKVNPAACDDCALHWATNNNHATVVKLLLSDNRVKATSGFNYALRKAMEMGYYKTFVVIWEHLKGSHPDPELFDILDTPCIKIRTFIRKEIIKKSYAKRRSSELIKAERKQYIP